LTEASGDAVVPGPPGAEIARSVAWRWLAPLSVALVGFVLFFVVLRLVRTDTVFYYTEGPVLGSLAALEADGGLSALYPADGWVEPPVVLTLYPPMYFALAATVDRWAGSGGTFLGLRVVSAAALLGLLALVAVHTRARRVPPLWVLALVAAVLMTPAVYQLVGGGQADTLALFWTWVGITAALGTHSARIRESRWLLAAAGAAFFLAFFAKQSFVAAPAALVVSLFLTGRRGTAAAFGLGLAAFALCGVFILDSLTAGGYLANTLGALTGGSGWSNLTLSLSASEPVQWLPIVVAVLLTVRRGLRLGFPELYLLGSTLLHTVAMLKTGSSVNYLLEPTFALLLLAVSRYPARRKVTEPAETGRGRIPWFGGAAAVLLATVIGITTVRATLREYATMQGWLASAGSARVSEFEGYPLVDAHFFPAVLARGGRPWLNDPFAFGALEEIGQWDPSRLVADLESHRIPFALTTVALGSAPAPPGVGTREIVMAYFWRSRPVWSALTGNYRPLESGPITAWLPLEVEAP